MFVHDLHSKRALQERICEVRKALLRANLPFGGKASQPMSLDEYCFKHEPADYNVYWDVRKGLIPIVGAARETGASGRLPGPKTLKGIGVTGQRANRYPAGLCVSVEALLLDKVCAGPHLLQPGCLLQPLCSGRNAPALCGKAVHLTTTLV